MTFSKFRGIRHMAFAALVGLMAGTTTAAAEGPEFSANLSGTSDYVFRCNERFGFSATVSY